MSFPRTRGSRLGFLWTRKCIIAIFNLVNESEEGADEASAAHKNVSAEDKGWKFTENTREISAGIKLFSELLPKNMNSDLFTNAISRIIEI